MLAFVPKVLNIYSHELAYYWRYSSSSSSSSVMCRDSTVSGHCRRPDIVCVCVCSQATHIACCILSDDAHAMSCRGISNKINLIIIQWCVLTSIEPSRSAVAPVTTRLSALFTFGARLSTTVLSPVRSASVVLFLSLLALSTTYTPTSLQLTPYSRIQVNLWLT